MKKSLYLIIILSFFSINVLGHAVSLVPKPAKMELKSGSFIIDHSVRIKVSGKEAIKGRDLLLSFVRENFDIVLNSGNSKKGISLIEDSSMPSEAYNLIIDEDNVVLRGNSAGLFYGIQTLQQLFYVEGGRLILPALVIEDKPRFEYRGVMLDVARYFYSIDYLKEFIDLMAHYKLNVFHWHLTEDGGWRIEIKKYPQLTQRGAWRNSTQYGPDRAVHQDRLPHGGFYTQEQIKDLVEYASERHVTIIPEVEMPGHCMAALSVFPEFSCKGDPLAIPVAWGIQENIFCAGNDAVFSFLEDVLSEVILLFPSKYIHIGGDEAPKKRWQECPKCQKRIKEEGLKDEYALQSYFIRRIERFLNSKGKQIIGWDEILEGGLSPNATVMSWRGEAGGIAAATQHHDVIMAPNVFLYLDYYQSDNREIEPQAAWWVPSLTLEKTYSYEPYTSHLTEEQQKYIKGVQGNLWGEFIHSEDWTYYMGYPRILALAEIGWSPQGREYQDFLCRVPQRLAYLDKKGIPFRIPEADEVRIEDGKAEITFKPLVDGAEIYYTLDGTNPLQYGKLYRQKLSVPLTLQGIQVKYVVVLPSGRYSAVYSVR